MTIAIPLILLSVGVALILASLFKPASAPGMGTLRYGVPPGSKNRSWMMSGGLILALGGVAILLFSR